jgi:hypothetical protein
MTAALQESLFEAAITEPRYERYMSLDERWLTFHEANPQVYVALRRLALDLVRAGNPRIGAKMLAEVVRWRTSLQPGTEVWKINNSYISRYSRLLARAEPELADAFETRALAGER